MHYRIGQLIGGPGPFGVIAALLQKSGTYDTLRLTPGRASYIFI